MKRFQETARGDGKGVRWILDQTARPCEFSRDVDESDRSRDPDRAGLAGDPHARVAQGRAVENDFIQQKKQRQADSHLLGVESQHVQEADGDQAASAWRTAAGANACVHEERAYVQRIT
jgi:hypothetical protein